MTRPPPVPNPSHPPSEPFDPSPLLVVFQTRASPTLPPSPRAVGSFARTISRPVWAHLWPFLHLRIAGGAPFFPPRLLRNGSFLPVKQIPPLLRLFPIPPLIGGLFLRCGGTPCFGFPAIFLKVLLPFLPPAPPFFFPCVSDPF